MSEKSPSTDLDVGERPEALRTMNVFNELLVKLRYLHEEVCARNAVLEGQPAHVASKGTLDDPWLPINFWPPMDDPAPCHLPWGTQDSPKAFDVQKMDGLARQQECLRQGIDGLVKQQQQLCQQLTQGIDGLARQQQQFCQQLTQLTTTHPVREHRPLSFREMTHMRVSGGSDRERSAQGRRVSVGSERSAQSNVRSSKSPPSDSPDLRSRSNEFKKLGSSATKQWRNTLTPTESIETELPINEAEESMLGKLSRMVHGHRYGIFFDTLIFLNCLLMAFELQYHGMNYGNTTFGMKESIRMAWAEDFLQITDWVFGILFTVELIANIMVHRLAFFVRPAVPADEGHHEAELFPSAKGCEPTQGGLGSPESTWSNPKMLCSQFFQGCGRIDLWGALDFCVVFFWIIYRISSASLPFDPRALKLARLAKLLRMLKLVKIVSSVDSLYLLTTTIHGSISALAWSVVLLLVIQALLSFLLCQQLSVYCEDSSEKFEDRKEIWRYFGTYTRALFTMFELTLGNWVPVGRALMDKISMWFFVFSLMHKLIIGFAVVNVMNGVFMQTTFKIAATDDRIMIRQRERQSKVHRQKMSNMFQRGDIDGTGFLTREAFADMIVEPAFRKWMASMELSIFKEEDIDAVFGLIAGEDNRISLDEFVKETSRLKGPARTIDLELRFQEVRDAMTHLVMSRS